MPKHGNDDSLVFSKLKFRSPRPPNSLERRFFSSSLRRKSPGDREFSITIFWPPYVSPRQECFAMRIPIGPADPTPAQSADAAFQALQAYSAPAAANAARSTLIDSVTEAVNAYYKADTGKSTVDVKDPHYSEAKAQVAVQLETEVVGKIAASVVTGQPVQLNGLGDVLKALQPGQTNVTEALQQFLPTAGPEQMPTVIPPGVPGPQKMERIIEHRVPIPVTGSSPGEDKKLHMKSLQVD
jgi:hypothetical protein